MSDLKFSWPWLERRSCTLSINDPRLLSGIDCTYYYNDGKIDAFGTLCILHGKPYILWEDGEYADLTTEHGKSLMRNISI
jgi:hypothetical protein